MNGSQPNNNQPAAPAPEGRSELTAPDSGRLHPLTAFFDWFLHVVQESEIWKFGVLIAAASVWHGGTGYAVEHALISDGKGSALKVIGWLFFGDKALSLLLGVDVLLLLRNRLKRWLEWEPHP